MTIGARLAAPLAVLEAAQPAEDGIGSILARERHRRGLSRELVAAATRIRVAHLAAIERDDLSALPGPVYARGYVRAYAAYLDVELPGLAEEPAPAEPRRSLSILRVAPRLLPRFVVTGPLLGGLALALLSGLFVLYAWREIESARSDFAPAPATRATAGAPPIASPDPLPSALPAATAAPVPGVRPMAVLVRVTDQVWIYVEVDGKPVYGPNGKFLAAGEEDGYVGATIKITSGKPAATLVSTDGQNYAPLGSLKSREWKAGQT